MKGASTRAVGAPFTLSTEWDGSPDAAASSTPLTWHMYLVGRGAHHQVRVNEASER
ncbi:hypothetical protein [Streptomyces sp. TP-A0356]|uniref:hypothetical protein n=1 Tax=Streptomyces sp. TP-A0356 TaxID=1359208 RepID=UPI00131BED24|nr:hypothetical protein [Streptomyces sp. TP-A0356]